MSQLTKEKQEKKPTAAVWIHFSMHLDKKRSHRRDCMHCDKDICRDIKTAVNHINEIMSNNIY